eukprot:13050145-Alexandrium_andersonii.AAC.1
MSASLVGSEMCIRDRRKSANNCEGWQWHSACVTTWLSPWRASSTLTSHCLLYTSDAADDM